MPIQESEYQPPRGDEGDLGWEPDIELDLTLPLKISLLAQLWGRGTGQVGRIEVSSVPPSL